MTRPGYCPICRGGISGAATYHHSCLLRTVKRLPKTVDGVPMVPGMEVFAFTDDGRKPNQPRPGHVVRIANGSDRVTLALRAPTQNRSTFIGNVYANYDEAVKDVASLHMRLAK